MNVSKESDEPRFRQEQATIELKSASELDRLRVSGQATAKVLQTLSRHLRPGVTTKELDTIAFDTIRSFGMKPAFLGYRGYPSTACISINEELVHGIPRKDRVVREGDIVSIDLGVISQGFYGDCAATFPAGTVPQRTARLLEITEQSLRCAIDQVKPGNRLGDVSSAVQRCAEEAGYGIVRDYVGHGIGRQMHEDPPVPNFGKPGTGPRLLPGMVIAIEPMVTMGDWRVRTLEDGWTVVTVDRSLCAHFEHMVAVTENGHEVLTQL